MLAPFSLTVGFMLPHPPYVARQEDFALYAAQMTMPKKTVPFGQVKHPFLRRLAGTYRDCGGDGV